MSQVSEGEPTHALLEQIASLSQGQRLWFERGEVSRAREQEDAALARFGTC